jgi:predicted dehydrogenase
MKIVIIGLGRQMVKDHIPAIQKRNDLEVVALVEKNKLTLKELSKTLGVPGFTNLKQALDETSPDFAIVSVPHDQYVAVLEELAKRHIATLKEKPLAMTYEEATRIVELYQTHKTYLQICVQRRFSHLYETTQSLLNEIGTIYSLYAEYTLDLKTLSSQSQGWRADKKIAGGGAALDLGYHTVDLLTTLFGMPDKIYAQLSYNSFPEDYTIDDSMKAMMTFRNGKINANMLTTKIFNKKGERIRIFGADGSVYIDDRKVSLMDHNFNEIESHTFSTKEHEVDSQLDFFVKSSQEPSMLSLVNNTLLKDQLDNMKIIDAIYKSSAKEEVIQL